MSEVKRFYIDGRDWAEDEDPNGDWVLAEDYDALAAQRDEGLAREQLMRLCYEQCKQRLAESEELLRGLKQNGLHAFNMSTGLSVQDNIDAFLAIPCCTDGEKQP